MRCGAGAVDVVVVPHAPAFGAELELASLERRIEAHEHERMRALFPEGGLFTLSFTGFAEVNVAVLHPDDTALREHVRGELVRLLALSENEREQAPFSSWAKRGSWRGVILEGHQNLLRAGYVMLGGADDAIVDAFHRTSAALFAGFVRSPSGALESFWGRTWYVDNAVALESLRLHDVLYGTRYSAALERFRDAIVVDDRLGLPVSEVSIGAKRVLDGPRGCALSWLLAFPAGDGPEGARDRGWDRYVDAFTVDVAGMRGLREYPRGHRGTMNVDSGPIAFDIGAAASAFGIAAARYHDDGDALGRMLLPLEILTLPSITLHGDEELFFGQLPAADAIAVWARTVTRWDAPKPPSSTTVPLLPTLCAELALLVPVLLALRFFLRALARLSAARDASRDRLTVSRRLR